MGLTSKFVSIILIVCILCYYYDVLWYKLYKIKILTASIAFPHVPFEKCNFFSLNILFRFNLVIIIIEPWHVDILCESYVLCCIQGSIFFVEK